MLPFSRPWGQGLPILQATYNTTIRASAIPPFHTLSRRYYGGIVRAIVSKHVESISDTLSPVLPPNLRKRADHIKSESTYRANSSHIPNTNKTKPIELEDDVSTTESGRGLDAEMDIQTEVRRLMRLVPHPVAIVTSTDPNSPPSSAFRGMTVSSFNTVTLSPKPVISFNVKLPSETYNAIRFSSRFLVHLLSPTEAMARLALEFSKGYENVARNKDEQQASFFRFTAPSDVEASPSLQSGEPPRLVINGVKAGEDGRFPFIFECQCLPQTTRIGDHVVIFGTVVNVLSDQAVNLNTAHSARELCLSYADTRFWEMGDVILPSSPSK
ncbi:putative oxidoreductase [Trichophyton verrucosum HKI 0517]|uniref:Oxidoreductase n=1 Tax=Trichophyton verrucosum (strain HKI 0517) TaxID=663202 RepID=D4D3I1_TRIVH|nr:putative oxidoreductase [Trichophyton verrucosum HKI 0517]EFE43597.1 putative oxidoreductase [Trichophyton verrucosum HKI 0517]